MAGITDATRACRGAVDAPASPTSDNGRPADAGPVRIRELACRGYQPTLTSLNEIVKYPAHGWTPLMLGRIA